MLLLIAFFLFRTQYVQNYLTNKITNYLSKELHIKASVGGINIELFNSLVLEKIYIEDQHKDTLIYIENLSLKIKDLNIKQNKYSFNKLKIDGLNFEMKYYKNEKNLNLQFLIDYFASKDSSISNSQVQLFVDDLQLINSRFQYQDQNTFVQEEGMNYFDLNVDQLNTKIKSISIIDGIIKADLKSFALREKSGFVLNNFSGNLTFGSKEILIGNLNLETPFSKVDRFFSMKYSTWSDFLDFNNKVRIYGHFENTNLAFHDIAFFAPALKTCMVNTRIKGIVQGTVGDLKAKQLDIFFGEKSLLSVDFKIKGLPDIDHTYFDAKIHTFLSNDQDINITIKKCFNSDSNFELPSQIKNLGDIIVKGNFKGRYNNFKNDLSIQTSIGQIMVNSSLDFRNFELPKYSGNLKTIKFNAGTFLGLDSILGEVTMQADIKGQGFEIKNLSTTIQSKIDLLELNNYTYSNISLDGNFLKKDFLGTIHVKDKNLDLEFNGNIDLNNIHKPYFNFTANLNKANLKNLNLSSDSILLNTTAKINFSGKSINDLNGKIELSNTYVELGKFQKIIPSIILTSHSDSLQQGLYLRSQICDINIVGKYDLNTVVSSFKEKINQFVPSLYLGDRKAVTIQNFSFDIALKSPEILSELFFQDFKFSDSSRILGTFNNSENLFRISAGINSLEYKNFKFDRIIIDGEIVDQQFGLNISANKLMINDSIPLKNVVVSNKISNDSLQFNIKLADVNDLNRLDLNGQLELGHGISDLTFLPSELIIDNESWKINNSFQVIYSEGRYIINEFSLMNKEQKISASGFISEDPLDEIRINYTNINLSSFNQITKNYGIKLSGLLEGSTRLSNLMAQPMFTSKSIISNLVYNNDTLGTIDFNSFYNQGNKQFNIQGKISYKEVENINLNAEIDFNKNTENLKGELILNDFELKFINPFVKDFISNVSGTGKAVLKIGGSYEQPEFYGKVYLNNASLKINYLQTQLNINDYIEFNKDQAIISNFRINDSKGNEGYANGLISFTKGYANPYFDIQLRTNNFLCLNTSLFDNELYYGKAFATGSFDFKGYLSNLFININASTNEGTEFFIPIDNSSNATKQSFINFVNKKDTLRKEIVSKKMEGLTINISLNVNDNAKIKLIIDQKTGDYISAKGNGGLRILVSPNYDLRMYGVYNIEQGKYLFTFQNVSTKTFDVEKGGSIRWDGDPANARINLVATYQLRPSLYPIFQAARIVSSDSTKRALTECKLGLKNNLLNPDISFDIDFPEDQNLKSTFSSYLSNQDNVTQQFISLLLLGKFYSPSNSNAAGAGLTSSLGELLNSQLSNFSQSIYKGLNLNVANGLGGRATFFKNRLDVSANFINNQIPGSANTTSTNINNTRATEIAGDVTVEYKIDKKGNFRASAFNRTANNTNSIPSLSSPNQIVQGIGISYKKEFDTYGELIRSFRKRK